MDWLSFRVLVEVLLGTGARISEALSLKRTSINFQTGEATIIGKGNKERVSFFSPRSLNWIKEYVNRRKDQGEGHPIDHVMPSLVYDLELPGFIGTTSLSAIPYGPAGLSRVAS